MISRLRCRAIRRTPRRELAVSATRVGCGPRDFVARALSIRRDISQSDRQQDAGETGTIPGRAALVGYVVRGGGGHHAHGFDRDRDPPRRRIVGAIIVLPPQRGTRRRVCSSTNRIPDLRTTCSGVWLGRCIYSESDSWNACREAALAPVRRKQRPQGLLPQRAREHRKSAWSWCPP